MYGRKFEDINTLKNFKDEIRKNPQEIFTNKDFCFYRVLNFGDFSVSNYCYILELDKKNFNSFSLYEINKDEGFKFNINNSYYIFSKKKIVLKRYKKVLKSKKIKKISEFKEKYWGRIITLFNKKNINLAAKLIYMNSDSQSSLEYHLYKHECYFIHEGHINLGLRYARANQTIIKLKKNSAFEMYRGIMHMRMSKKNSLIVEISTYDNDSDSHIVEDGNNYIFLPR